MSLNILISYVRKIFKMAKQTDPERLARLLWDKQILNKEAADLLGVHERTIYKWLSGDRRIPSMVFKILEREPSRQTA